MQDVISAGPDRPRRPPPRLLVVVALIAAVVVAALVVTHLGPSGDGAPVTQPPQPSSSAAQSSRAAAPTATSPFRCPTTGPAPAASGAPAEAAALAIGDPASATALLRRDTSAIHGPWSVIVRRDGGSFGSESAVVTFPAGALDGSAVDVGGRAGTRGTRAIVWPIAGARAQVRGDLPDDELLRIARDTTIAGRRPVVRPPAGYTASAPRPYRPTEVHELRYNDADLGQAGAVLGFVYTGVLRGAAFEDELFALDVHSTASVAGHPAFVSTLMGGNATLAWSPAPGVVAYVGYSGGPLDARTTAALGCLARASRLMSDAEWRATRPVVGVQPNDIG